MNPKIKRRAIRALIIYAVLFATWLVLSTLERRRVDASVTTAAATPSAEGAINPDLMADVQRLSAADMEGRRTGTPGSRRAQDFIVGRLEELKVPALVARYRQPFSFTRRSIRGMLSPSGTYINEYPEATNIAAVIRGTASPERFIAVSAHYDHFGVMDGELYPGADDNASGVAALLAVARDVAARPLRHSVLILVFDAEELGLRGARHFVEHPLVDLQKIDALVNLDMVGRGDANTLVAAGTSYYPQLKAPVVSAAEKRTIRVVFGHDRPMYRAGSVEDWTHSSDHGPFHEAGVPFLYFGVEDHADYHKSTDTADKIPARFLGEVVTLLIDVVRALDGTPAR